MDRVLERGVMRPVAKGAADASPILFSLALLPVFMALATWSSGETSQLMAFFHVPVLAVEMAVIVFALRGGFHPLRALMHWPRWALGALALLLTISVGTAASALDPASATLHTSFMALHLLFGMALFDLATRLRLTSNDHRRFWIWVTTASVGYVAILALFVATISDPQRFDWVRLGLGVVNVRQVGFYCIPGACAALGLAATARRQRPYWAAIAAASVMIGVIVWSGSRGPLVAIAGVSLLGATLTPVLRSKRSVLALVASTALGTGLSLVHHVPNGAYGLARILGTAGSSSVDEMGSGRVTIWLGTLREIVEGPLFGYGASQFRLVVPEALGTYNSPHNLFLQIALQWGLVGAACFFGLFGIAWWRFMRLVRAGSNALVPAFLVVNALLIFSLYDVVAYYAYPIVMIAVGIILVLGSEAAPGRSRC